MPDVAGGRRLPPTIATLPEAIAWWARETPHALAVLPPADGAAAVSFGELEARVPARTAQLEAAGIAHGNRVAFRAGGEAEAIVACLAVMRAGVALPLPPAVTGADLTAMLRQFRPSGVLIGSDDVALALAAEQARVPQLEDSRHGSERVATTRAMGRGLSQRHPAADDLALILQSSGATGRPRGVPRTHRNLLTGAAAFEAWIGREALERGLVTTPLSFGLGVNAVFAVLSLGGGVVPAAGMQPVAIVRAILRWRPTWTCFVPALLEDVPRAAAGLGGMPPSPWRAVGVAGMASSGDLARRVEAAFGVPPRDGFGCGEAGLIAGSGQRGTPGQFDLVFTQGIATLDENGAVTAPGVPGEIVVWGPQVSSGYVDDPEATARAFLANGWFRTGDLGTLDGEGRLRLTGRLKEIINRGGEKLAPAEIDAALLAHPTVAEAAAFAIRDERLGEEVAAVVVPRAGARASERELRRALAACLAPAKAPRRIWFVESLPRTGTGKVRRGELSRRFAVAAGDPRAENEVIVPE